MRKGFTVIELLVVITILAILAGAIVPAISRARQKAREDRAAKEAAARKENRKSGKAASSKAAPTPAGRAAQQSSSTATPTPAGRAAQQSSSTATPTPAGRAAQQSSSTAPLSKNELQCPSCKERFLTAGKDGKPLVSIMDNPITRAKSVKCPKCSISFAL